MSVTVTLKRYHPEATHASGDENGVLRIYKGAEVIAEYERGEGYEVTYTPPLFVDGFVGINTRLYGS